MGADPEHGRRRPCSRECCMPNTRAQEREAVRREVDEEVRDDDEASVEHVLGEGVADHLTEQAATDSRWSELIEGDG